MDTMPYPLCTEGITNQVTPPSSLLTGTGKPHLSEEWVGQKAEVKQEGK